MAKQRRWLSVKRGGRGVQTIIYGPVPAQESKLNAAPPQSLGLRCSDEAD